MFLEGCFVKCFYFLVEALSAFMFRFYFFFPFIGLVRAFASHHPAPKTTRYLLDRLLKAQVHHLVGLVEDEVADEVQSDLALVDHVEQAAGGGAEDVGVDLLQPRGLVFEVITAWGAEKAGKCLLLFVLFVF